VADAARALVQAQRDAARRREQLEVLRAAVQRHLARCDALVEEIEATIALDLLPNASGVRERYVRALDVRQRAAEAHRRAVTVEEMMALNDRLQWALHELETTRHALAAP
jgi:hypothetical protein